MKLKQQWFEYSPRKNKYPDIGVEVLFCDKINIWVGKILEVQPNRFMVYVKNENGEFVWAFRFSNPTHWRYLPSFPEKNPKDTFSIW